MLRARDLIDQEFGGVKNLHAELAAIGHDYPVDTVYKWRHRNSVPGEVLALCLVALERKRGAPVSLDRYVETKKCKSSNAKPGSTGAPLGIFD